MIRTMLKPFFKRFAGLFISMTFISMLSIGLLCAFASTIYNLKSTFVTYLQENGNVNAVASIGFFEIEGLKDITSVDGVEKAEYRITFDAHLKKDDGRTITSRIFTTKDDESSIMKLYVLEKAEIYPDKVNVAVVRKFAENNGFKIGDKIGIGYFGLFVDCYINEIVETPEAIQARANNYVWSDNTDFGYIYINESQFDVLAKNLADKLEEVINSDETIRGYYEEFIKETGLTIQDCLSYLADEFTKNATNQILVTASYGYTEEQVAENVKNYLENKSVQVSSVTENHKMFYYMYIENAIRQLQIAAIFLPVFFYAVTMIVIGLFINQIIKEMTPQIGVMMSIGVGKWDIISIFIVFTLLMSVLSAILGTIVGVVLNRMLAGVMITVYSMPTIPYTVQPLIAVLSVLTLMIFAMVTTVISCKQIFNITPKDATISNEAKRKRLSPKLEALIDRAPMNIKLGVNSIAQNPRRFFVSVFSIFAAFVIIVLSCFFYVSKSELMAQTVDRRLSFDVQVYMTSVSDKETIDEIAEKPFVTDFIDCYYTYVEVTDENGNNKTYLECLAYDENIENNLVKIPSENGRGNLKIQKDGLILPKSTAEVLGVNKGDKVIVNGVSVTVNEISFQYFHPITYLSKTQLGLFETSYVSSFLVNVNDEDAFLSYMSDENAALSVFTSKLSKDIHGVFNSIDVFIYIMIGFSLAMAFIILSIMSQNALLEQKRQISVLRLIGFTIKDVSNLWTIQSVSQLILSSLLAIPVGALASSILFGMCSSATQVYPFVFSLPVVGFAFGFVFLIILASHIISMATIKKWNLADNTRSRE